MPTASQFLWYSYQSGGCGARRGADGNSAEWHLMANSKNESMEVWETRYPVEFLEYCLLADSGGRGRWRGGLGPAAHPRDRADAAIGHLRPPLHRRARGRRRRGRPPERLRDRARRRPAQLQEAFDLQSPSKFANLPFQAGDVFVTVNGGGGGLGQPEARAAEAVASDALAGYAGKQDAE